MFHTIVNLVLAWVLVLMIVATVALARARDIARRLVFADLAVILLVGALVLTAIALEEAYYLDAALALSLLSFVSSIVIAINGTSGIENG